ncbi:hypothetical protein [Rhizosaccharibacter radicis]|uniref:Uncharacterized protein n=1 Tax=Rhizosaccharibacter radicis TaxID=2782605 RepID=A0ABT1VW38_9PROT|nr:hypothetical protein [Acetobacteraceae bacterium KSS12]
MPLAPEVEAAARGLLRGGQTQREVARELGLARTQVGRVHARMLLQAGAVPAAGARVKARQKVLRAGGALSSLPPLACLEDLA